MTTSLDGFIKQHSAQTLQTKKSFFVCQSGLTAAALLNQENESFAVSGINNEIYLFSFYTGTTIRKFYAHDDFITQILYKKVIFSPEMPEQELLITTSAD